MTFQRSKIDKFVKVTFSCSFVGKIECMIVNRRRSVFSRHWRWSTAQSFIHIHPFLLVSVMFEWNGIVYALVSKFNRIVHSCQVWRLDMDDVYGKIQSSCAGELLLRSHTVCFGCCYTSSFPRCVPVHGVVLSFTSSADYSLFVACSSHYSPFRLLWCFHQQRICVISSHPSNKHGSAREWCVWTVYDVLNPSKPHRSINWLVCFHHVLKSCPSWLGSVP